jgi:hypothetical protein
MDGLEAYDPQGVWCFLVRGEMGLILTRLRAVGANDQPSDPDPDPDPYYRRIGHFHLAAGGNVR